MQLIVMARTNALRASLQLIVMSGTMVASCAWLKCSFIADSTWNARVFKNEDTSKGVDTLRSYLQLVRFLQSDAV